MPDSSQILIISFLIIVAGYFLKKINLIRKEDGKVLSRVVLNFTFPALILAKVRKMPLDAEVLYLPLICFSFCVLLFIVSYFVFKDKPAKDKGLLLMSMGGFNVGLFAYPIVEGIWGAKGLQYLAMFDLGNALIILGVGYFIGDYFSPLRHKDSGMGFRYIASLFLKSVPFISYFLALSLNYFSVELPSIIDKFLDTVSQANMPVVLLLVGIYFKVRIEKAYVPYIIQVILMRYVPGLALGLLLYYSLPFDQLYRTILLVGLTLPVGLTVIPFSDKFGYNTVVAASLANLTIAISFILLWLYLGFRL